MTHIECDTCFNYINSVNVKDRLNITDYVDEYVRIDANIASGRWLILSNANIVGWSAYIDGQKTEIHTANYILQAIYVPSGQHVIEFKYQTKWWLL